MKIHHAVDGKGRPLSVVVTGGQRNDGSMLQVVIDDIRVPQPAGRSGRPRTTPDAVMADRAYPSRANREYLRDRGIAAVIPEKVDHVNARKRKGSAGGRPPKMDWEAYKGRNVVERSFNLLKQWRGLATRYDKLGRVSLNSGDAPPYWAHGRHRPLPAAYRCPVGSHRTPPAVQ
jgi:transposase